MRKILCMLIAIVMLTGSAFCAESREAYNYEKEMEFVRLIGLISEFENASVTPEKPVVREVYNNIMNRIWGSAFSDYLNNKGMVTSDEVLKTMVDLLGYSVRAEISTYKTVAYSLGLSKNVTTATTREITAGELAAILYNAQDVALYELNAVGTDKHSYEKSDKTFLSGILRLKRVEDVLTDNGYTSLNSLSNVKEGNIKIGNESYKLPEDYEECRDLIGKKVWGYVTDDEYLSDQSVVGITELPYEKFIEIEMKDFVNLLGNEFSYEENEKIKKVRLSYTPDIIYNGKFEKTLKKEFFNYDYGTIFLGSSEGRVYDVVIIEGYVSWYISAVDMTAQKLYPSLSDSALPGDVKVLDVSAENNTHVRLYDKYGDLGDLRDFYKNTVVDICYNDGFIKVITSDKNAFGVLIDGRDNDYYYVGEDKYGISEKYEKNPKALIPEVGKYYDLYINSFGYVVKAENMSSDNDRVGIFLGISNITNTLQDSGQIKVYSDADKIEIYDVNENVIFSNEKNISEKLSYNELYKTLKDYSEIMISYKLNSNEKIVEISLPTEIGVSRQQGRFGYIIKDQSLYYESTKNNLEGRAIVDDGQTKIFTINTSENDEKDRYSLKSISNVGSGSKSWRLFNREPGSQYAEYGIVNIGSAATVLTSYNWIVVTRSYIGLDSKGNPQRIINGYRFGGQRYAVAETYVCESDDVLKNVTDIHKSGTLYEVEVGDIILASKSENKLKEIFMFYKHNLPKAGKLGMIAGNLGYHDSLQPGISNPFILNAATNALATGGYTLQNRVIFGYVQHLDSRGNMTVTTQDVTAEGYDETMSDSKYTTEYVKPYVTMAGLTYTDKGVTVKTNATSSDARAYDVVGDDCSRVIILTQYGTYSIVILINGGE